MYRWFPLTMTSSSTLMGSGGFAGNSRTQRSDDRIGITALGRQVRLGCKYRAAGGIDRLGDGILRARLALGGKTHARGEVVLLRQARSQGRIPIVAGRAVTRYVRSDSNGVFASTVVTSACNKCPGTRRI